MVRRGEKSCPLLLPPGDALAAWRPALSSRLSSIRPVPSMNQWSPISGDGAAAQPGAAASPHARRRPWLAFVVVPLGLLTLVLVALAVPAPPAADETQSLLKGWLKPLITGASGAPTAGLRGVLGASAALDAGCSAGGRHVLCTHLPLNLLCACPLPPCHAVLCCCLLRSALTLRALGMLELQAGGGAATLAP